MTDTKKRSYVELAATNIAKGDRWFAPAKPEPKPKPMLPWDVILRWNLLYYAVFISGMVGLFLYDQITSVRTMSETKVVRSPSSYSPPPGYVLEGCEALATHNTLSTWPGMAAQTYEGIEGSFSVISVASMTSQRCLASVRSSKFCSKFADNYVRGPAQQRTTCCLYGECDPAEACGGALDFFSTPVGPNLVYSGAGRYAPVATCGSGHSDYNQQTPSCTDINPEGPGVQTFLGLSKSTALLNLESLETSFVDYGFPNSFEGSWGDAPWRTPYTWDISTGSTLSASVRRADCVESSTNKSTCEPGVYIPFSSDCASNLWCARNNSLGRATFGPFGLKGGMSAGSRFIALSTCGLPSDPKLVDGNYGASNACGAGTMRTRKGDYYHESNSFFTTLLGYGQQSTPNSFGQTLEEFNKMRGTYSNEPFWINASGFAAECEATLEKACGDVEIDSAPFSCMATKISHPTLVQSYSTAYAPMKSLGGLIITMFAFLATRCYKALSSPKCDEPTQVVKTELNVDMATSTPANAAKVAALEATVAELKSAEQKSAAKMAEMAAQVTMLMEHKPPYLV